MNLPKSASINFDSLLLLTEGELDRDERENLFRQLDDQDGAWRTAALLLLETQMLHRQVKSIGKDLLQQETPTNIAKLDTLKLNHEVKRSVNTVTERRVGVGALRVLAAMIVFALGIGFAQIDIFESATLPAPVTTSTAATNPVQSEGPYPLEGISKPDQSITNAVYQTFKNFSIDDGKVLAILKIQNEDHEEFVPVMQSPTLERQWLTATSIAPTGRALSHLNRNGWNLIRERQFVALQLPNQHNKIVPLDVIKYEFAGPSQAY